MNTVSLESLIASGCFHLTAASLVGQWLLCGLDSRRLTALSRVVLSGIGLTAGLRSAIYSNENTARIAWSICCSLATVVLIRSIRLWATATPAQLHAEDDPNNQNRSSESARPGPSLFGSHCLFELFSGLIALACLLFVKHGEFGTLAAPDKYFAGVEVLGKTFMLAIALFLCLELTLISTPDSLIGQSPSVRVNWGLFSSLTMFVSLLMLVSCLTQFLRSPASSNFDAEARIMYLAARVYGLMLLLATFVLWMITRRLIHYQRATEKPRDWVTLTLAAWLSMLAFVVVAMLPANWPWRLLMD